MALTMTYGCLFGEISDQDYRRHLSDFIRRREQAVKQAIQDGKEPFDFAKFAALYAHDRGSCKRLDPNAPTSVQNYYRNMYYKDFPTALTIHEFVRQLHELDMQG